MFPASKGVSSRTNDDERVELTPDGSSDGSSYRVSNLSREEVERSGSSDVLVRDGSLNGSLGRASSDSSSSALDDLSDNEAGGASVTALGVDHHSDSEEAD